MKSRRLANNLLRKLGLGVMCAGVLMCMASSGEAQAPVITEHPVSQFVLDCKPVTFSVVASGRDLQYQWFRDDAAVTRATNSTYTIERATYRDSGSVLFVVISNEDGSVTSSNAVLTVSQDPNVVFVRWAYGSNDGLTVFVQFSTVVTNADDSYNYTVFSATNGDLLGVLGAIYVNGGTTGDAAVLRLSAATPLVPGTDYNLMVENVSDECGNMINGFTTTPILKPVQLMLTATASGTATLRWTGTGMLQAATNLISPLWQNFTNATSPYGPFPLDASRFFRVRVW